MKLKPCPFCGTERTRIREWLYGAVIICECGAQGPEGFGGSMKIMACDLWNRRTVGTIASKTLSTKGTNK